MNRNRDHTRNMPGYKDYNRDEQLDAFAEDLVELFDYYMSEWSKDSHRAIPATARNFSLSMRDDDVRETVEMVINAYAANLADTLTP